MMRAMLNVFQIFHFLLKSLNFYRKLGFSFQSHTDIGLRRNQSGTFYGFFMHLVRFSNSANPSLIIDYSIPIADLILRLLFLNSTQNMEPAGL